MSKEMIEDLVDKLRREMMLRKPPLASKVWVIFRKYDMTHEILMDWDDRGEARFRALDMGTEIYNVIRGSDRGLSTNDYAVYVQTEWDC